MSEDCGKIMSPSRSWLLYLHVVHETFRTQDFEEAFERRALDFGDDFGAVEEVFLLLHEKVQIADGGRARGKSREI